MQFKTGVTPVLLLAILAATSAIGGTTAVGSDQSGSADLPVLESRLRQDLLDCKADAALPHVTSQVREPYLADSEHATRQWMQTERADGSWPDIDYADKRRSDWPVTVHTARMAMMAIEHASPKSKLFGDRQLAAHVLSAWDWWTRNDLQNSNWYPNRITNPSHLCTVALLLKDQMSAEQLAAGLEIMKRAKAESTGSNLTEMAIIQIAWGCLANDPSAVGNAFEKVAADMRPRTVDGLQPDHSFRYHGRQLYAGSYGSVYTSKAAFLIWLASDTRFSLPADKTAFFSQYVLDGQRWMVYGGAWDPGAIGRTITITDGPSRMAKEKLLPGVALMAKTASARQQEFISFSDELLSGKSSLSGNRFFWNTLFMTHRRPDYYVSIRMFSDQVDNAELCNSEGLQTHHTADGVTIIERTGDEYSRIFPVWDWRRIPGITAEASGTPPAGDPRRKGTSGFAGGVSDGVYGAAAFDLQCDGLSAKKAWFCFDREVVCLGTDIQCSSQNPVLTSVNQCRLRGEVTKGKNWVIHDGIGYLFAAGDPYVVKTAPQTGSWRLINGNLSDDPVEQAVFSLWLDHGKSPTGAAYQYIIVPGAKPDQMPGYLEDSSIVVLRNDANVQAVLHRSLGIVQAVFRNAGEVSLGGGRRLAVDAPCVVIVNNDPKHPAITVAGQARPTDRPTRLRVNLSGTSTLLQLPQGELAGRSITRAVGS